MRIATLLAGAMGAMAIVACSSSEGGVPPTEDGGSSLDAMAAPEASPLIDAPAPTGCGDYAGDTRFTCAKDGNALGRCIADASSEIEPCPRGCLRKAPPEDDVCMGTTDPFSCTGAYGTVPAQDGDYYMSQFGCWVDPQGGTHSDTGDNCIPSCLTKAKAAGLCLPGDTGPDCERRVNWFTADGARFGCLAKLRVTNPMNGKTVIAVALDFGPGCPGENNVQKDVLDSSGALDLYLFGGPQGSTQRSLIHVVQVDDATPLGPVP